MSIIRDDETNKIKTFAAFNFVVDCNPIVLRHKRLEIFYCYPSQRKTFIFGFRFAHKSGALMAIKRSSLHYKFNFLLQIGTFSTLCTTESIKWRKNCATYYFCCIDVFFQANGAYHGASFAFTEKFA